MTKWFIFILQTQLASTCPQMSQITGSLAPHAGFCSSLMGQVTPHSHAGYPNSIQFQVISFFVLTIY